MNAPSRRSRIFFIAGLVCMIVGLIDPLEGSVIILLGIALVALGAFLDKNRYRRLLLWSFLLTAVGVGALWIFSALGGVQLPGDPSGIGLPMVWGLLLLPYPIGWVMAIVGVIQRLRESPERPAPVAG